VGRLAELERLEDALARATAGERQIVCVTGEAGLGKTTLVQAFLAVAGGDRSVRVAQGRCIEHHGAGEAYLPVLEALGRMCAEPGGDALVRRLAARAPAWLVQLPGLVPAAELASLHQEILGATRERMLREMVELLDELASDQTLVLVLEDMHWSDYSTLDLLTALAHRADAARLLVLGTYRPGDAMTAGHPLHQAVQELRLRGHAREIALEPLAEQAVEDYLRSRFPTAGDLPDGLAARVRSTSGGNPLFVETLVDALARDGLLVDESGRWRDKAEESLQPDRAPDSLRLLIEQQLARLDEDDQAALETASVAGREFAAASVAAGLERSEDELEDRLSRLARRGQFVVQAGPAAWPDGTVSEAFRFAHDLYPEVLSARIPAGRRARLHHRIGVRLEAAYHGDRAPVAPELAGHFVNARDAARATEYLELAATQALRRNAPRDAVPSLEAALEQVSRLAEEGERARLELRIQMLRGPAIIAVEGWASAAAEAAFARARELAETLADTDALIAILYRLATLHEVRGEYVLSETLIEQCLALEPSQSSLLVDSHVLAACSLFHQGKHERTLDHAERGVTLMGTREYEPINAVYGEDPVVSCHGWSALALWFLGFPDRARDRAHEAIRLSDDPRLAYGRSAARLHAAIVHQLRREPERVSELAQEAFALSESQGYLYRTATGRVLHGWAAVCQGRLEGLMELRAGIDLARTVGARMDDGYFLALLAEALEVAGEREEGLEVVDEALRAISEDRTFFFEPELLRLRASLLATRGEHEQARATLVRAVEVAEELSSPSLALRAAISLARLGNGVAGSEARERIASIHARFGEGFDTPDLKEAAILLEVAQPTGTGQSS
jgi:type II secretory pathway predicted ATPase ExeA/tetratricopeptide (TPR) repeat protein